MMTVDASPINEGISATLFILRDVKPPVAHPLSLNPEIGNHMKEKLLLFFPNFIWQQTLCASF